MNKKKLITILSVGLASAASVAVLKCRKCRKYECKCGCCDCDEDEVKNLLIERVWR